MEEKGSKSIRVDDWTYQELSELKEFTGVTYGNLIKRAIPLLDKKYKRKKVVKETENGSC